MPEISISPDLPAFLQQAAQRRVVSVHARLQADDLTAVGLYHRLCGTRDNTFLLESADNGMWSRWSFVGVHAVATLSERGGEAVWSGRPIAGLPTGGDPLQVLAQTLQNLEADGFVYRVSFPVVPPHVEYSLTPLGEEVAVRVTHLTDWIELNMDRISQARPDEIA